MPKLTLVSCLFDLAGRQNTPRRTVPELLAHGKAVLALEQDLVVFTEPELVATIAEQRQALGFAERTKVIPLTFEQLPHYDDWLPRLTAAHQPVNRNSVKDTVHGLFMGWSKPGMMACVAEENPFAATHVGWLDFGIAHARVFPLLPESRVFDDLPSKIRLHQLRWFNRQTFEWSEFWKYVHCLIAAGWMVGDLQHVRFFAEDFAKEAEKVLAGGYVSIDEDVIASLVARNPGNYEMRYGGYHVMLHNSVRPHRLGYLLWYLKDAYALGSGATYVQTIAQEFLASHAEGLLPLTDEELGQLRRLSTGPLLALVMIVKNEAERIRQTLDSVKPWIDTWAILDTGSTDGTQKLIAEAVDGIPGWLDEEPIKTYADTGFIDYAATRNRGLELAAKTGAPFYLLLNGDDFLEGGAALRAFCEAHREARDGGYYLKLIEVEGKRGNFVSTRLMRAATGWRYVMPTHEVLCGEGLVPCVVPGVEIRHFNDPWETRVNRWHRDATVLERYWQDHHNDHRTAFYLAQTHECLGEDGSTDERIEHLHEATRWYRARAELGGWREEVYESKKREALVAHRLRQPWTQVQEMLLSAHAFLPHRLEALWPVIQHWHEQENHALVCLYGAASVGLPVPDDVFCVEPELYEWKLADLVATHALYAGQRELGERAAVQAVRARPHDGRLHSNLNFYSKSARELFGGYESRDISFEVGPGLFPTNPSIMLDGERRCGVVRFVNYEIRDGFYHYPDGEATIRTLNYWVDFDRDWNLIKHQHIIDLTDIPRTDFPVHGYEDCRLSHYEGSDCLTAVACDLRKLEDGDGAREIVLLRLNEQHEIESVEPLRGAWSDRHQKNWLPYLAGDGVFRWIYSTEPYSVTVLLNDRKCGGVVPQNTGSLRGGSQAIMVPGGYLWLVHEVTAWPDMKSRTYMHRFVFRDHRGAMQMTPQFYFERRGIEFAAGLALDGERLVISYGVNDREARIAFVPLAAVMRRLEERG